MDLRTEIEFRRLGWALDAIQKGILPKTVVEESLYHITLHRDESELQAYIQEQEARFLSARNKGKLIIEIENENCGDI